METEDHFYWQWSEEDLDKKMKELREEFDGIKRIKAERSIVRARLLASLKGSRPIFPSEMDGIVDKLTKSYTREELCVYLDIERTIHGFKADKT